jgi:phosphate transport system permease protein
VEAGAHAVGVAAPGVSPLGVAKPRRGEQLIKALLFLAAAVSVLTTVLILVALLKEAVSFFGDVGLDFITDPTWAPLFEPASFGIRQLLVGTFMITGIAILVAVPIGLGAAVYLSEYASPRVRRIGKPMLEVLVGVPTVVFGYFALAFVTPTILQDLLGLNVNVFNALSAGLVMGFMIVPTIASISEDSMRAVPQGLREGAFGLGATKRQVSTRVVFPAAISGIMASIILAISRAIGETMAVVLIVGSKPQFTFDPRESIQTMTAFIAATAQGDVATGTVAYKTIFAVGATLFVMTLAMNLVAIRLVRRFREVYE